MGSATEDVTGAGAAATGGGGGGGGGAASAALDVFLAGLLLVFATAVAGRLGVARPRGVADDVAAAAEGRLAVDEAGVRRTEEGIFSF